ncbi:protein kinase [bacterium]|nr:protein kinase [bacterium]
MTQKSREQSGADAWPARESSKNSGVFDPTIGRVIGDFRIEAQLGQGGMGTVYRGRQLSLDRPVALKFLKSGPGSDPKSIARFEAEARVAAALNHPNVVGIYTLGNCDGLPFIAMELVPGRNLGQILGDCHAAGLGPPGLEDCLSIMRQATAGIQAAAELGLVHRDIKPENLMLTPRGVVKVADFGLARDLRPGAGSLTETGYTLGTPLYMSPEQVLGRPTDARSDLYSLGMTFHHLLTGQPPLSAESPYLLGMKQVQERPDDVRTLRPDCPEPIARVIMGMIEKRPEDRPASAAAVAEVLSGFDSGKPAVALAAQLIPSGFALDGSQVAKATEVVDLSGRKGYETELASTEVWSSRASLFSRRGLLTWIGWTLPVAAMAFVAGRGYRRRMSRRGQAIPPVWPPSLDLADWSRIPRRESPEKQYRQALLWSEGSDRIAAWLAVPGYFSEDPDWSWRAYVQLSSHLVNTADTIRLVLLKDGVGRCGRGVAFEHLADVLGAALDGAEGNEIGMLETLHLHVKEAMDPALAELILAILANYRVRAGEETIVPARMNRLQSQLMEVLRIDPKIRPIALPNSGVTR